MISKPIVLSAVAIVAVVFVFAAAPIMADMMKAHAQSNTGIKASRLTPMSITCHI
jgi:hypothetical protein